MIGRAVAIVLLVFTPIVAWSEPDKPIEVMVVGDFHMANPGADLHDPTVDDMLSARRQAQIEAVDQALARFGPTLVAAEGDADEVAEGYPKYLDGTAAPSRNELTQLAFRLAKATGARMAGVDADGDFPYPAVVAYAKAHGQEALLNANGADIQRIVDEMTSRLDADGVSGALRYLNDPERLKDDNGFYRDMLKVGAGVDQPGVKLLSGWYTRNFQICANIIQLAKPGDRVVVFFGSGHAFLLRQCVQETPGFVLIEPNDYLPR
jgi:uncharacterized protein DUF5694